MLSPAPSVGSRVPDSVVAQEAFGADCVAHCLRVRCVGLHVLADRSRFAAFAVVLVAVVTDALALYSLVAVSVSTSAWFAALASDGWGGV